jgi:hypothetical protein
MRWTISIARVVGHLSMRTPNLTNTLLLVFPSPIYQHRRHPRSPFWQCQFRYRNLLVRCGQALPKECILIFFADPSQRLSRLVPQNASRHRPCPALIATYLNRARLPESTVAFAACILDSLSRQFVRAWRKECDAVNTSRRSAFQSTSCQSELIVLAALAIANGFLDDVRGEPRWWASYVACGAVQLKEVDATIRCVFKDLDYDLCGFTADEVDEMRQDCFGQRVTVEATVPEGFVTPN